MKSRRTPITQSKGKYAPKDVEEWAWRELFLRRALEIRPKTEGPSGRTLSEVLIQDIRPLWQTAQAAFHDEMNGLKEGPGSVTWYLTILVGQKVPNPKYNKAWFRKRRAWPLIEAAIARTLDLFRACNLNGFVTEKGETASVLWVQESGLETIQYWLLLDWAPGLYDLVYSRHPSGSRYLFPLQIPIEQRNQIQAWHDGGHPSFLGWEHTLSVESKSGEIATVPITPEMENPIEEGSKLMMQVGTNQVSFGMRRREVSLSVTVPNFDPLSIMEAKWREETRAAFEAKMDDHIKEMLQVAGAFERAGEIVQATLKREPEHFEWLARYQVGGETWYWLAKTTGKDRKAIKEAVRRVAKLVNLPLRPSDS
jgi:hypothetical protein